MDHMQRLSREDPNLPLVSNSGITDELKSSGIKQQAVGQSIANSQAVIGSSNLTVTSSLDSTATGSSDAHVVASNTSTSNNFVSGALDSSSINTNVPEPQTKIDKTERSPVSSLLGREKTSESSLLAQFTESKSQILGFRSRQSESKASDELQNAILEKFKDNIKEKMARWREDEALLFMHGIMDECTHLRNVTVPVDKSLIVAICAKDDAYVPREGFADLLDIWPGAEVRFLDAGHSSHH